MYCKKCGFITKGDETKCPYCGAALDQEGGIDRKICVFDWFEISIRKLICVILFDLFATIALVDVLLISILGIEIHLAPWAFLVIFGTIFAFNEIGLSNKNTNRFLLLKSLLYFTAFAVLFILSYPSWNGYAYFGKSSFILAFGYYFPTMVVLHFFLGFTRFFLKKNFNAFSAFFYVIILTLFSSSLFFLVFIPAAGLTFDEGAKWMINVSFAASLLFSINAMMFSVFFLKSRFSGHNKL
jgi:hypothetical protein